MAAAGAAAAAAAAGEGALQVATLRARITQLEAEQLETGADQLEANQLAVLRTRIAQLESLCADQLQQLEDIRLQQLPLSEEAVQGEEVVRGRSSVVFQPAVAATTRSGDCQPGELKERCGRQQPGGALGARATRPSASPPSSSRPSQSFPRTCGSPCADSTVDSAPDAQPLAPAHLAQPGELLMSELEADLRDRVELLTSELEAVAEERDALRHAMLDAQVTPLPPSPSPPL